MKPFIAFLLLMAAPVVSMAQSASNSAMSVAVMRVYDKMIENDPTDYETLLARAGELYNRDEYLKAISDLDQALRYAPESARDIRFSAHQLRAGARERMGRYADALDDLNAALQLDPSAYTCLYQRANVLYELGRYADARADYQRLQRQFPHSQEAAFGLARCAAKEQNFGMANDLADRAVDYAPDKAESYIRRASVRSLLGNTEGAVDDYIIALSMDNNVNTKALNELVVLARTNYPAVMNGLSRAIRQAPRVGMFYYIRAAIAENHYNYTAAIDDYDKILNDGLYSYAGLNSSLAKCFYALGQYDTALANADYAISATEENAPYYALKARILCALGEYREALVNADQALAKQPGLIEGLEAKATADLALGHPHDASVSLAEAILDSPNDPRLLLLRAWVCSDSLAQVPLSKTLCQRAADAAAEMSPENVRSLLGFALMRLDRIEEADRWMENILNSQPDYDGMVHYYAACYYAHRGMIDRAVDCAQLAMQNGYADYHNWMDLDLGYVNVEPLRSDPRFHQLMVRYASIFNR